MPAAPLDTDCRHIASWMRASPRVAVPLDEDALAKISLALSDMGVTCATAGKAPEFLSALVKTLAALCSDPAFDLTEGDVSAASHRLREALYLEIMRYRRAARADAESGTSHD